MKRAFLERASGKNGCLGEAVLCARTAVPSANNGWWLPALACLLLLPGGSVLAQRLAPNEASQFRPTLENPNAMWRGELTNWVELSVGHFFVSGSDAEFQRRSGLPASTFGGIESLHYEHPVATNTLLTLDGRAIFDNDDYLLQFELVKPDLGFVRGGYREFRTWYDRHGGFLPIAPVWFTPFSREGHIDRGEIWTELGLTLPDIPKFTFRYSHQFREGTKDTTIWGDFNLNAGVPGPSELRNILPGYWDIDEQRDIFELDMTHEVGGTDFGIGVRYELIDQNNDKNLLRRLTEAPPIATPGSQRALTQNDSMETDLFNAHAFTETAFSEKVLFTTAAAFTTLDTDISGNRIYGEDFDPVFDPSFARRQRFDEGFLNLSGGSNLKQYLVNLNLLYTPWQYLRILPSVRVEKLDQDGSSDFIETNVGGGPAFEVMEEELLAHNNRDFLDISEALELRSAVRNWALYVRGEWLQGDGTLEEREFELEDPDPVLERETDSSRFTQKYIAGLSWYPLRRLSFAAQYYHKIRDNEYDHILDSTTNTPPSGDRYPAYLTDQDFKTDDVNFRVTWRPWLGLSLVSRYDFQLSTIESTYPRLREIESAETTSHILSQSISLTPIPRLNLQASVSYALDQTDTPANDLTGDARDLVLNSENDYWNGSFLVAFALNEKTDLQAQYFYYRADNYLNNSRVSVPYGAGAEEHGVTATLIRQITNSLRWTLKYGFFTNNDETFGGFKDYTAHLVYSSIQYRF